ncbi:heavy metal-binding domain-containing protein [Simiduia curdlanivorans]|uniref:YbjQ family protein n=1 Tax=Simiduia curdlanivorans TaxID=1492769 RepID=A0ABV8V583_9GAMM|nr:heavy metal-binding domain-containing protein [Simiduia curdlanivorans]MDN3640718.1 heavy metal-binding domain-containing protein [Simiduia curdlanivorans]
MEQLIVFLLLLLLGYFFGRAAEKKHFASIIEREAELKHVLLFSMRLPPVGFGPSSTQLVGGNVVVSIDYFKRIAAALRNLLGGRVTAYESLLERARREAILRMKQQAQDLGATQVINVKLETASIYQGQQQQIGSVEVYAYGTALVPNG